MSNTRSAAPETPDESDADLEGKFRGLVDGVIPDTQAQQLIARCAGSSRRSATRRNCLAPQQNRKYLILFIIF